LFFFCFFFLIFLRIFFPFPPYYRSTRHDASSRQTPAHLSLLRAIVADFNHDRRSAEVMFETVAKVSPSSAAALLPLARFRFEKREFDAGCHILTEGVRAAAGHVDPAVFLTRALGRLAAGQPALAIRDFDEAVTR
jgi:hypothetical protein